MNIRITRGISGGRIAAIPAKADAHRAFIAAALSGRTVRIRLGDAELSQDIAATLSCLEQSGARIVKLGGGIWESSPATIPEHPKLDCRESGSTLRFLLPVAAALGMNAEFTGAGRLPERPLSDLMNAMTAHGAVFSAAKLPFTLSGKLTGGKFELPGNISSQYITGILFALYAGKLCGEIVLTTHLESSRYADMTVSMLRRFGAKIRRTGSGWSFDGAAADAVPESVTVEGDWSNAAAFLVAGAVGGKVTVTGLDPDSEQPDRAVIDILRRFGAEVSVDGDEVSAAPGSPRPAVIDVSETPDLLPVLSVLAAHAPGKSRFINAARLRLKESDRLASTARLLKDIGAKAEEYDDALEIDGGLPVRGGTVDVCNDHRLVMAAAVAASLGATPLTVPGADAVNKSQPGFFADFAILGGEYRKI